METALTWCVAVGLVLTGVAADVWLAWMFVRDWRVPCPARRIRSSKVIAESDAPRCSPPARRGILQTRA